ncbi:MAG: formylglycine-generating enzyme family protein [Chromatiaceae bacterium]|nr:formylglycine-generating enzyme family protein [Chromatiaceae bacterium]
MAWLASAPSAPTAQPATANDDQATMASITWSDKLYDPAPSPSETTDAELTLPMPCGGAMVFRAIEIPAGDLLDDRPVEIGQTDADRGYKEGRRLSYIAGAFSEPTSTTRRYYIAKYETTRDQYAALNDADCPTPSMRGRLPMTDVSWFDALQFSRRYTEWLLANAPSAMPHEEREPGFLRLPTEEEWEFSARGGLKVDETDFLAPVFPMPEGDLARYAWFESTRSAEGELHPIGLLKPNPLGLHDILGNAAEMTFAPFKLDRRGRAHGQSGGFVSRGGDVFTPESQISSAERQEHNYFNATTGKAKSLDSLGFRLVLTAPVIVSPERLDAIKQAWSELPSIHGDVGGDATQALKDLKQLADQSSDDALRSRLQLIQRDMEKGQSELNEARARTLRALLRMGAFLAKRVVTDQQRAKAVEQLMVLAESRFQAFVADVSGQSGAEAAIEQGRASLQTKLSKWQAQLDVIRDSLNNSLSYYGDMAISVGRDYGEAEVAVALDVVSEEFRLKQNAYLIPYAQQFVDHLGASRRDGSADKPGWQDDLMNLEAG